LQIWDFKATLLELTNLIVEKTKMFDVARNSIRSITELGIALLALAIIATLLVGPANMAFLGDVVGNIMALVKSLGSAGLVGLISLGVVLWLFKK
jgi:hypothetical protein